MQYNNTYKYKLCKSDNNSNDFSNLNDQEKMLTMSKYAPLHIKSNNFFLKIRARLVTISALLQKAYYVPISMTTKPMK
jgi:hypothetical protein